MDNVHDYWFYETDGSSDPVFCVTDALLTELPPLYNKLKKIYCRNNGLIKLPQLPPFLKILNCPYNDLIQIPPLPPNLEILVCNNNPMYQLPHLHSNLKKIWISPWQTTSCLINLSDTKTKIFIKN
jgi:hypothetical protein